MPKPTPAPFAARLRALRAEAGLSLRSLGERAGVAFPFISKLEHGRAEPGLAVLVRLADALGCTLDSLAGRG